MPEGTVIIIGAGQAAAQTATSLRQGQFTGKIIIIGDEPALPYQRPPLSKAYLKGELEQDRLYFKNAAWYETQNIEVISNATVTAVDADNKTVEIDSQQTLGYDHLVFATGSRNRRLPLDGAELPNVLGLRNLADVDALRRHVGPGRNLVIIGAGYIGLETAAVAKQLGADVTVLELSDRVLSRVTSPVISAFYESLHERHGVSIRTDCSARAIHADNGKAVGLSLSTGETLACDAVLIGIGILPNDDIAREAGVVCEDGIVVDETGQTNIDGIYAAGDCAKRLIQPYGRHGRLESVHNAIEQGKQVAAAILGNAGPKLDCPWFWSDQYDVKLQIAGLSSGFDAHVIRGDVESDSFCVFYFKDGTLIAADAINRPIEFMTAKRLIPAQAKVRPALLADETTSLKDVAATYR